MKFDYFIDSHCHMHDEEFYAPHVRDELVKKAIDKNVKKMILIGTSFEDSFDARDYALSMKNVILYSGLMVSIQMALKKSAKPQILRWQCQLRLVKSA